MRWPWEPSDDDEGLYVARNDQNVDKPMPQQWFVDYLPVTGGNYVGPLIDGEAYMGQLYDALLGAKKEVVMTGLHFDPGVLLRRRPSDLADKRPGREGTLYHGIKELGVWPDFSLLYGRPELSAHPDSLLGVLKRVAEKKNPTVKIYILVNQFWKDEGKGVANLDVLRSEIAEQGGLLWYLTQTTELFQGLAGYPNVFCRTDVHPRHLMSTHHQKTVVIDGDGDSPICFVGGIDLTATDGDRWDTHAHEIPADGKTDRRQYALGEHLWHDVHCRIEGPAVRFVLDNFRARWNHGQLFMNHRWEDKSKIVWELGSPHSVPLRQMVADADPNPVPRDWVMANVDCYQAVSRQYKRGPILHTRAETHVFGEVTAKDLGKEPLEQLRGALVQVVRSMPEGRYWDGTTHKEKFQKPYWNLAQHVWERSAKDAYLIGIRAAREYIYLENQWVADEDIWEELRRAMWRNRKRGNSKFRIVVVIPRRPLTAAGLGRDQDYNIMPLIQRVRDECKDDPKMFGMYSLVQTVPERRRRRSNEPHLANLDWVALSDPDVHDFGEAEAQIYVHSKILIIDDCWSLIGSANAGGISLAGLYNPNVMGYTGSTPDSELSVIVYDKAFAKKFREALWKEHLQCDGLPATAMDGADLFRTTANEAKNRVRHARFIDNVPSNAGVLGRQVVPRLRYASRIVRTLTIQDPGKETFTTSVPEPQAALVLRPAAGGTSFKIEVPQAPAGYTYFYWWRLIDEHGGRWQLRTASSNTPAKHYTQETTVLLGAKTREGLSAQKDMTGPARVLCRVSLSATGAAPPPFHENADDPDGFVVELDIALDRS